MEKPKLFALIGNPNSGKTALFNLLTKSGEPCGNRAGVTFTPQKAPLSEAFGKHHAYILDLPGIYSLDTHGNEEKAALLALKKERPHAILNIVDSTDMEKGLRLTLSLFSLGYPIVVALTMADELPRRGLEIDTKSLSKALGVPVFLVSALKKRGISELLEGLSTAHVLPIPRFFASPSEKTEYIQKLLADSVKTQAHRPLPDDRIDRLLCCPIIGIPLFFAVMALVFYLTFSSLGSTLSACLEAVFASISIHLKHLLLRIHTHEAVILFLTDGVWMGVSAVLSFLPQTAILFFLLAILEDSGYLARAAYVMDTLMRRFGVSGQAVIPMLIGVGCTVPAVMSCVTLDSKEKEKVISVLPFIPCSARLPVILMIASAFFPKKNAAVSIFLYLLCFFATFLSLLLFQKNKKAPPLILELPPYRMPHPASLFREVKQKLRDFLLRAGTVVFLSCSAADLLAILTPRFTLAESGAESILARFGAMLTPLFIPLGFGDGRLISALAAGFFAKESIVSVSQILIPEGIGSVLTPASALSFAVFSLMYLPCAATFSAVRKELGMKKALLLTLRNFAFAALFSYLFYTISRFLSK